MQFNWIKEKYGNEKIMYVISVQAHGGVEALSAVRHFIELYEAAIKTEPDKWLFLIEGIDVLPEKFMRLYTPEIFLLVSIACKYGVDIKDPIISPYHIEVVNKYMEETGISKKVLAYLIGGLVNPIGALGRWDFSLEELTPEEREELESLDFDKLHNWLLATSNKMSQEKLKKIINDYPDKKKFIIYLGKAHTPILENINNFLFYYI